jgi:hypothetical protein
MKSMVELIEMFFERTWTSGHPSPLPTPLNLFH